MRSMSLKRLKLLSTIMPSISLIVAAVFYYCFSCFNDTFYGVFFSAVCFLGALFFGIIFLTSFLTYLAFHDLESIFTKSIYDGTPAKPSLHSVLDQLSAFLFDYGQILKWILPRVFPFAKKHEVRYSMTGRIFTYFSISTLVYWVLVIFIPFILLERLSSDWQRALAIISLFVITIVFLWSERVFSSIIAVNWFHQREKGSEKRREHLLEGFIKDVMLLRVGT